MAPTAQSAALRHHPDLGATRSNASTTMAVDIRQRRYSASLGTTRIRLGRRCGTHSSAAARGPCSAKGFEVVVEAAPLGSAAVSTRQTETRASGPADWWVNNKQTNRQEIAGGYLWSPRTKTNGARNETYHNMGRVRAGDLALAYASQRIAHVGVATQAAVPALKPLDFGTAGANWARDGWMVLVRRSAVPSPLQPKAIIDDIRPHLPRRHSPLQPTTRDGNQNVYLAADSKALAELLLPRLYVDEDSLRAAALASGVDKDALAHSDDAVEDAVKSDAGLSATEREAVIAARRGQGRFRAVVLAVEPRCRLTGVSDIRLLRASHIRPWRACETHAQRLDGENGLMLTPTADHLFDKGFISFADDGTLLVSPHIDKLTWSASASGLKRRATLARSPAVSECTWPTTARSSS
ncbi:HNH endonuclease [Neoroseomonas terrae]